MNASYHDTGFPHGVQLHVHVGDTTISGNFHILNVINTSNGNQNIAFNNQDALDTLSLPNDSILNLSYPIHCTEFTPSDVSLSVVLASGIR